VKPEDVTIRQYCGEDEVLLAQINPANMERMERNFLAVLKRVLQGLDPTKLTLGDRLYIIIWEYINSYAETVKINAMCSSCLQTGEFTADLRTLDVLRLPEDFHQPQEVELPVSKKKVKLRLLTVGDRIESEKLLEKNVDTYLYECACSIVCEDSLKQMEEIKGWPTKDTARLRLFQEQYKHGPILLKILKCPVCGAEVEVSIPFRFSFFFPVGSFLRQCFGA
jgi:hypothetical protein